MQRQTSVNRFSDTVYVSISNYQDRRISDSLYSYFDDANEAYREQAVLAFASIQDSLAASTIARLLTSDDQPAVRRAAAFALGQTNCRASEKLLLKAFTAERDSAVRSEIVTGYGKVTRHWALDFQLKDSILYGAIAWGMYRAGLNGHADSALNLKAAYFLKPGFVESARLGAAHYFARSASRIEAFQPALINFAITDRSEDVRMAATLALRKIHSDSVLQILGIILHRDSSYRVRTNAVRALQPFPIAESKPLLIEALHDKHVNVAIAASEAFASTETRDYWKELVPLARTAKHWRVKANLYGAALEGSDDEELIDEIIGAYSRSTDVYSKAALLHALGRSLTSFDFIRDQLLSSRVPVISSAAASALVAMNYDKEFIPAMRSKFAGVYAKAISMADAAVIGIVGSTLIDAALDYKIEVKDTSFLEATRTVLTSTVDKESRQTLEAVIAYFEGKENVLPVSHDYNHPIDWKLVKEIPTDQRAIISTSKGEILIRLYVEDAPGSVSNFISLTQKGYYDDKFFHRVVPNFVAQGGCNRGDGYGAESYTIRSEFSERLYTTGSLGMASSGKDTENTQWFITHSPTPHLDGRYTIFAAVESGMDVVHALEVGDKILKIELRK